VLYADVSRKTPGMTPSARTIFFALQCVMEKMATCRTQSRPRKADDKNDDGYYSFVIIFNISNPFAANFVMPVSCFSFIYIERVFQTTLERTTATNLTLSTNTLLLVTTTTTCLLLQNLACSQYLMSECMLIQAYRFHVIHLPPPDTKIDQMFVDTSKYSCFAYYCCCCDMCSCCAALEKYFS
jgi:hypothetical protein